MCWIRRCDWPIARTIGHRYLETEPRAAGVSLVEMLIAMGILAVGMVAIAAMLTAGISMQADTTDQADGQVALRNATALVITARMDWQQLHAQVPHDFLVHPLPAGMWPEPDRSYPMGSTGRDRRCLWHLVVQRIRGPSPGPAQWMGHILVGRGGAQLQQLPATHAGGRSIAFDNDPRRVHAADLILDDHGIRHLVVSADAGGAVLDTAPDPALASIWITDHTLEISPVFPVARQP